MTAEELLTLYRPGMEVETNPEIPDFFDGYLIFVKQAFVMEVEVDDEPNDYIESEKQFDENLDLLNRKMKLTLHIKEASEKTSYLRDPIFESIGMLITEEDLRDYPDILEDVNYSVEEYDAIISKIESLVGEPYFTPKAKTVSLTEKRPDSSIIIPFI